MSTRTLARLALAAAAVAAAGAGAAACGRPSDAPPAAAVADTAAAPPPPPATTLVVGGRYETQGGSVVCPAPEAMRALVDVARGGDAAAFSAAIERGGCSPVVAGAVVTVAEQQERLARVRRANDTSTYWMLAEKLTPR